MAFGLDVLDLIYTDPSKVDLGTLEDYEVDLDLAVRKDFELRIGDYLIEKGAMWYVEGTEFGGIIDGFETNPESYQIKYTGRSWRGVLDSKVLFTPNLQNTITVSGKLDTVLNTLFQEYGVDSLFICEAAELDNDETVKDELPSTDLQPGLTLYDAVVILGNSLGFTYNYIFNIRDKKVHLVPNIPYDYSDYLTYCRDNSISISIRYDDGVTNHLVCSGIDEVGQRRTIHIFTDAGGTIQPYLKDGITNPAKDDDYILDESKKVVTGIDEVVDFYETNIVAQDNYQLVTSETKPFDWDTHYSSRYFQKQLSAQFGEEMIFTIPSNCVVNVGRYLYDSRYTAKQGEKDINKSNYWLVSPETVAVIVFDDDYKNEKVVVDGKALVVPFTGELIVNYADSLDNLVITYGAATLDPEYDYSVEQLKRSNQVQFSTSYKNQKVSLYETSNDHISYEPLAPNVQDVYSLLSSAPAGWNNTYSYYYTRSWSEDLREWQYSAAQSTTTTDMSRLTRITSKSAPGDWRTNYGQYYMKVQTGTGIVLQAYSGISSDKYVKMTAQPTNWAQEYNSYYRIRYVKTVTTGKKKKEEKEYATYVKGSQKVFRPVPAVKKKVKNKNGKYVTQEVAPTFRSNVYYRRDSVTNPPAYNKSNCWLPASKVVAPTFETGKYFSKTSTIVPPTYKASVYYELLEDHYLNMVLSGVQQLAGLRAGESQNISVEDLDLNIGDTVGGEDEITGAIMSQVITNKIIKIVRGVTTTEYEIGGQG